ncbi:MAG TPA: FkbM family methyltransferase [Ginsengibacter sp.]
MTTNTFIHNFFRLFGVKFGKTVSSFGNKLAIYNIKKNEFNIRGDKIFFKELNLEMPFAKANPILERYHNALLLSKKGNFTFFINANGELVAKNEKVQFRINDEEELFILSEVFLEGAYNLISSTQKKIALIDVGMNVGITTLFFASKDNVEKVFSFEPFQPTFSMALQNINLNKEIAAKINPNNFGLAKEDADINVSYSPKEKGRMGTKGLPKSEGYIAANVSNQLMHLKCTSKEFLKIKDQVKDNFVVCKIDTEGAEYEIIDSLYNANILSIPDVYFIEWHEIKPVDIVAKLKSANYQVIETTISLLHSGMIYAIKSNN